MSETEESIRQKYPLVMDEHEAPDPVKTRQMAPEAPKPAAVPQPAKQKETAKETATAPAVKPQVQAAPPKQAGQTPGKKADALLKQANATSQRTQAPAPEVVEAARKIYESGKFLEYCKVNFGKVWYGDIHVLMGVLLVAANLRVINAHDGVHVLINGPTQSGKSDSVKKSFLFVSPRDRSTKTFSKMYLFHGAKNGSIHEKMLIFSDDTVFNEETAAIYRNMLTSWFSGVDRGTVENHGPIDLHIPPRVSLILTSIESVVAESEEGQDESRFLTLEVRRTPETLVKIREFIQDPHPDIGRDLEIVYAVWDLIAPQNVTLHKKVNLDITMREFTRYLSLIQAHAILCNRTTTTDADFIAIDQFLTYSKPMINSSTAAFTRKESVVRQCLSEKPMTVSEIVDATGMTILEVYRALRGTKGNFQNPTGGLMEKEPRLIHYEERSDTQNNVHIFKLKEARK
jgi:hypothetical protein